MSGRTVSGRRARSRGGRCPDARGRSTGGRDAGGSRNGRGRGDRGSATIWAGGILSALCVAFAAVLAMGEAVVVRHRASAAADLAALAAARHWPDGTAAACAQADRVVRAQRVQLVRCEITGEVADVVAEAGHGPFTAESRARAGPSAPDPPPTGDAPGPPGSPAPPVGDVPGRPAATGTPDPGRSATDPPAADPPAPDPPAPGTPGADPAMTDVPGPRPSATDAPGPERTGPHRASWPLSRPP